MMVKPMKTHELHYPMIQFLIILDGYLPLLVESSLRHIVDGNSQENGYIQYLRGTAKMYEHFIYGRQ